MATRGKKYVITRFRGGTRIKLARANVPQFAAGLKKKRSQRATKHSPRFYNFFDYFTRNAALDSTKRATAKLLFNETRYRFNDAGY